MRPAKPFARNPKWREVVRRHATGDTYSKIAEDLGVTRATVSEILARPDARAHLTDLLDRMDEEMIRGAAYAPWAVLLAGGVRTRRKRK